MSFATQEYFYCGYSNLDGSAQDYSKFGKGTDFQFNKLKNRWEWNTKYTSQYIYPNGQYEQIAHSDLFDNQRGACNAAMEAIYKRKLTELMNKFRNE